MDTGEWIRADQSPQSPHHHLHFYSDGDCHTEKKKANRDELLPAVAASYRSVLKQVGEDPNREGLVDTPMRAAKAMMFFTKGYTETVQEVVKVRWR